METTVINQNVTSNYAIYNADCIEIVKRLPDDSIGMSIFSPPFASLYTYSNSDRDMGNCRNDDEFMENFGFLVEQLYRIMMPGRIVAVHCMNIPSMKERDGVIGLKDFRGDIIRCFQKYGFIFHSEHCIWKDPLIEATRTKSLGLMHKQIVKDSTMCRAGIPDYLLAFRTPGENTVPVQHPDGLTEFYGENPPSDGVLSHQRWRRYASPVWMDINQTRTLESIVPKDEDDEKHLCPLQLDVIDRALELWSTKGDTVLSPFMGIGSEVYEAVRLGRNGIGIELKTSYYKRAEKNLATLQNIDNQMTFDLL